MKSNTRIFLIGFMGVGKTTIGKKLAKLLGYSFIDTDKLIEKECGVTVHELFEKSGEAFFRLKESEVIKSTFLMERVVVATGGGLPCFNSNMEKMNEMGTTIYLEASPVFLNQRLGIKPAKRPLITGLKEDDRYTLIKRMLSERVGFYNMADTKVKVPLKSVEHIVESIGLKDSDN